MLALISSAGVAPVCSAWTQWVDSIPLEAYHNVDRVLTQLQCSIFKSSENSLGHTPTCPPAHSPTTIAYQQTCLPFIILILSPCSRNRLSPRQPFVPYTIHLNLPSSPHVSSWSADIFLLLLDYFSAHGPDFLSWLRLDYGGQDPQLLPCSCNRLYTVTYDTLDGLPRCNKFVR